MVALRGRKGYEGAHAMSITSLSGAIDAYQADAVALFIEARTKLASPDPSLPPEKAEEIKKRYQGQLAAAFSQLSNAETMRSAQHGRDGYAEVVKLMQATSTAATAICVKLTAVVPGLTPTSTEIPMIETLVK